jgi:hypothetical protein
MIRNRLESFARVGKRPYFDNISISQCSSSSQSIFEQNEIQISVDTDSANDENSDPDVQIVQFEVGKTAIGTLCLWHAGFRYTRKRGKSFRCVNRDCKATATITEEREEAIFGTIGSKDHNHPSNPQRKEALELRQKITKKIKEQPRLKPSNVISTTRAGITDEVFVELGSNKALEHLISRQKKRFFGNVDVADTLSINLPDSLTILRGQSILLYDSRQHRIGEKDVVLVFSHASLLEVLKKNKRWQIDGTLACAPTQWVQNFTVAAEVNKKIVVCAQSLLPGKHTKYYIEVLNSIKNAIQPHTPQQFMSDFECASLRALEQVFPDASKSGCMFHMSQALFRKWRRLGMEEIYADPINGELARKTFRFLSLIFN